MNITITTASVFVDDQTKALDFYTGTLGFVMKADLPTGNFRWLTVVGPDSQMRARSIRNARGVMLR